MFSVLVEYSAVTFCNCIAEFFLWTVESLGLVVDNSQWIGWWYMKMNNEKSAQRDTNTPCALAVRTPPTRYNARPPQTGPITIHCATKLSAQCNYVMHHICVVCNDVKSSDGWWIFCVALSWLHHCSLKCHMNTVASNIIKHENCAMNLPVHCSSLHTLLPFITQPKADTYFTILQTSLVHCGKELQTVGKVTINRIQLHILGNDAATSHDRIRCIITRLLQWSGSYVYNNSVYVLATLIHRQCVMLVWVRRDWRSAMHAGDPGHSGNSKHECSVISVIPYTK